MGEGGGSEKERERERERRPWSFDVRSIPSENRPGCVRRLIKFQSPNDGQKRNCLSS